jgi:uncharacterized membrane protein
MVDSRAARRRTFMTSPASNRAAMFVLAYLWPLALVPLLLEKDDPEAQWHAKHGLVLMAAEILLLFVVSVVMSLASLLTFSFGCALGLLVVALWIAILAVHLVAILKALSGSRLIVPGVSQYADRF